MSTLEQSDAAAAAVQKPGHPRVTIADIHAKIATQSYLRHGAMTICIVETRTGFMVVGKSAAADPANFNEELGRKFAYEDAVRQLWPLEGYLLRERLWSKQQAAAANATCSCDPPSGTYPRDCQLHGVGAPYERR